MRAVVRSRTYRAQLQSLLEFGAQKFGMRVTEEKLATLDRVIDTYLALHPAVKRPHPKLNLVVYPISATPFIVVYDFDEHELRLHFVFSKGAGDRLDDLDPGSAEW